MANRTENKKRIKAKNKNHSKGKRKKKKEQKTVRYGCCRKGEGKF